MIKMIAKVNYNLIDSYNKGQVFNYETKDERLVNGDTVLITTPEGVKLANFIGYNFKPNIGLMQGSLEKLPKERTNEYWNKVELRLLKDPLWVSDYAYEFYKNNFFFNEEITFEDARKKLTRNVILSRGFGKGRPKLIGDLHVFFYGSMEISVKGNEVVNIRRVHMNGKKFKKNRRKYDYLNEYFGIVGK